MNSEREGVDKAEDDLDGTRTCHGCGGAVSEESSECDFCGFDRESLDPENEYSGEEAGYGFR